MPAVPEAFKAEAMPATPMQRAKRAVAIKRRLNTIAAEEKGLKEELDKIEAQILEDMENEEIPESFNADGASIFTRHVVRFGPKDKDHAALSAVLKDLGELDLLPKTVNHNTLASYVREFLDPDETMPIRDRLLSDEPKAMPEKLVDVLAIYEETQVSINNAGVETKEDTPL